MPDPAFEPTSTPRATMPPGSPAEPPAGETWPRSSSDAEPPSGSVDVAVPPGPVSADVPASASGPPSTTVSDPASPNASASPAAPLYKGEPIDAERGPGLGCFWLQIVILAVLLVLTPLTVAWAWDSTISAALLIVTLLLLLFAGQTVIFLLRLVAADRRTRRRPLDPTAGRTVGQLEEGGMTAGGTGASAALDQPRADDPA